MSSNLKLTVCWGKLGQYTYPERFQPLLRHMIDVGICGQLIWDRVPAGVRGDLANSLGLSEGDLRTWLGFWIAAHDIGKAIPGFQFQGKTESLKADLTSRGFSEASGNTPFHADASVPILSEWLTKRKVCAKFVQRIAYAVGGHHGLFTTDLPSSEHELGNQPWRELQTQLLDELARVFEVPEARPAGGLGNDQSAFLFLAGLTTAADWIGSNEDWFPWCSQVPDNYVEVSSTQATTALNKIKWPTPNMGRLTGEWSNRLISI